MRIFRGAAVPSAALIVALLYSGCDSAPGVLDTTGTPPVVSSLEFSPDLVVFEQVPNDHIIGDSLVVVDVSISATVLDDEGDVDSVMYVVNTPFDAFAPLASGTLSRTGAGTRYSGSTRLLIPRGNSGLYTLIVYAVDSETSLSNQVRGKIEYQLQGGGPPVLVDVEGPSEVTRPAVFSYVAVVEDPDGLGNIASVIATYQNGTEYPMSDAGDEESGDEVANDGRYTVTFQVSEANAPGTFQFKFQAFDRQGHASEIVVRDLTVN